jgi:hypothetical protein
MSAVGSEQDSISLHGLIKQCVNWNPELGELLNNQEN